MKVFTEGHPEDTICPGHVLVFVALLKVENAREKLFESVQTMSTFDTASGGWSFQSYTHTRGHVTTPEVGKSKQWGCSSWGGTRLETKNGEIWGYLGITPEKLWKDCSAHAVSFAVRRPVKYVFSQSINPGICYSQMYLIFISVCGCISLRARMCACVKTESTVQHLHTEAHKSRSVMTALTCLKIWGESNGDGFHEMQDLISCENDSELIETSGIGVTAVTLNWEYELASACLFVRVGMWYVHLHVWTTLKWGKHARDT